MVNPQQTETAGVRLTHPRPETVAGTAVGSVAGAFVAGALVARELAPAGLHSSPLLSPESP